ncbi:MAG: hypothetical protein ACRBC3_19840 [Burkholderiaceae bacterium]
MTTQRESSRKEWTSRSTLGEINSGSLQRIADATEKMAAGYDKMRNDRDLYKRWHEAAQERNARLERRISALRGVVTKLKKRLANG